MIKYTATLDNTTFSVEGSIEDVQNFLEKTGILPKKEYPYTFSPHNSAPTEDVPREVYGPAVKNTDTLKRYGLREGSKIRIEEIVDDVNYYEKDGVQEGTILTIIQDDGDIVPKIDHPVEYIDLRDLKWSCVEY